MAIKLIACDLDGTLLNYDGQISDRTKEIIKKAQEKGTKFCIATGRMFRSACQFAKILDIKCPVISYNGALIKDFVTDEILYSLPLDISIAQKVLLYCKKNNWYVQKYEDDFLYVESMTGYAQRYAQKVSVPVKAQGDAFYELKQPPNKLMLVVDETKQQDILRELRVFFGEDIFITTSNNRFIEIINPGVNKGTALAYLCRSLNIEKDQVMALGDSFNDIEMLEYAGLAVAMGNAAPELKAVSNFISLDNHNDGVAAAIEEHVLK